VWLERGKSLRQRAATVDQSHVKVSDVLDDALGCYRVFWRYLAPLALIVGAAVFLLVLILVVAMGDVGLVAAAVVAVVANFWIAGLLIQTVDDLTEGDADAWIGTRFSAFWPLVNTVSVAAILLTLVMVPGLALSFAGHPLLGLPLIVGGVVLLTWWALVLPLIVIEQCSIGEAFNRSRELVAGHAWQVFGFLLLVGLLTGLLSSAVDRLALALLPDALALLLSTLFDTAVVTPFLAVALASLYFTLIPKESVNPLPSPA
jgi:hypothetical protein